MGRIYQGIAVALVVQLLLGPGGIAWSQAPGGKAGGGAKAAQGLKADKARPGGAADQGKPGAMSQTPAEESLPGGQALSRAVVRDEYVLAPGDGLSINLWGEYDATYSVRVTPDGKISLPTIGDLVVKGLSLTKAEALLESHVNRYYRNVKTGLSLTSLRVFQVLVLGEVQTPGAYLATPVKRVSDVIAQAGGVQPGGSQRHIRVRRGNGGDDTSADLFLFHRRGDDSANPFLQDGDVVFVPSMGNRRVSVYISEVLTVGVTGNLAENSIPYTVELKEGERLSTLIDEVGGSTPWWDLEGIIIQRETKAPEGTMRIPVDLRRYFIERDQSQDVVVEPGDQVYIPARIRRVFVAGAMKMAGPYQYIPGRTAEAYVAQAGGLPVTADLGRSFIKRADGTVEPYIGSAEINNGDTIIVLEKIFKTYQDYFEFVGAVAGVILSAVGMVAIFNLPR